MHANIEPGQKDESADTSSSMEASRSQIARGNSMSTIHNWIFNYRKIIVLLLLHMLVIIITLRYQNIINTIYLPIRTKTGQYYSTMDWVSRNVPAFAFVIFYTSLHLFVCFIDLYLIARSILRGNNHVVTPV